MYVIKFTQAGLTDVKRVPKNIKNRLKKVLVKTLAADPLSCSTELSPPLGGFRSFHWRQYRIVFRVFEDLNSVVIVAVGERSPQSAANIYRKLEMLASAGKLAESVLNTLRRFLKT